MNKPTCKVHGMIRPGAMCGHVIVGLKYCGFSGDCPHKSTAEEATCGPTRDAAGEALAAKNDFPASAPQQE